MFPKECLLLLADCRRDPQEGFQHFERNSNDAPRKTSAGKREGAVIFDPVISVAGKFCPGFLPFLDSFSIFTLLYILFSLTHV